MEVSEDPQVATPPGRPLPAGASVQGVWDFDGYRLDESARTLHTPTGDTPALDRSAFLVLQYLLLHAGQLCSQDELLAAGWPRRRVEVNSLAKCISRLRRLLGDEAAERIRLIHGYGYQLSMRARYAPDSALPDDRPPAPESGALVPGRPEWRLLRRIGVGACGVVYAANHVGSLPPRAYKFALEERGLRGLKRELALQRYLRLEHPALDCVLPVLDAALERPPYFLATPLQVQGNLAEWAGVDAQLRLLPREERLDMALALCEALAALHATGLAHRDLKPQNLYPLREDGRWRILLADLGAGAGMLPPGVDGSGVPIGSLTREGVEASSGPERYLAPELLAGAAATQRSDLYALGLLVFQIMVADLHATLAPGWEGLLADPLLAADIALAANLDPAARPATAAAVAERLRTLEARRAALREVEQAEAMARELAQLRQSARRRRQQLTVVLLMAALAVGGLLLTLQLYRGALDAQSQASAAQRQAELDARTARAVLSFMNTTLLDQADPWSSGEADVAMKALLERAAAQIDQRFHDEPASAAAVHEAVADAWEGWGDYARAIRHSRQALDLLATQAAVAPRVRARLLLKLCRQSRMAQALDRAEAACGAGADIERAHAGEVSPALKVEQAKLRYEQGRCADTLRLTDDLLHMAPVGHDGATPQWLRDALWFRGICHGQSADFAAGRKEFERLLALPWDLTQPADLFHRAWAEMDFAELLVMEGDFATAQPLLESAAAVFEAKLGKEHPDAALADYQRARIRFWSGDPGGAVPIYQRALDNWSRRLGRDHLWTLYTNTELLWARTATDLSGQQRIAAVAELLELRARVLPLLQSRLPQRSFFAEVWARSALELGELQIAAEELARSRADSEAVLPLTHPRHALLNCLEAQLLHRQRQPEQARRLLDRCTTGLAGMPPDNYRHRWMLAARDQLGR